MSQANPEITCLYLYLHTFQPYSNIKRKFELNICDIAHILNWGTDLLSKALEISVITPLCRRISIIGSLWIDAQFSKERGDPNVFGDIGQISK